jgi:cytochrome c556
MRSFKTLIIAASLVAGMAGAAQANEAVTKYRHYNMNIIGSHMKSIVMIVKGEVPQTDALAAHANGLAAAAAMTVPAFKEKSMDGKTEAKEEIWSDWAKFEQASEKFVTEANKMAEVAATGDMGAVGAQLGALGKTCKGCHEDFKKD